MKHKLRKPGFFLTALCLFVLVPVLPGFAAFVSPTIVHIEQDERIAEIIVHNRSNVLKMMTFEWERRAMQEGGKVRLVSKMQGGPPPDYRPADPYLHFSPRRTILRPGQTQKVRIIARRPGDLAEGEYRSHFLIKEEEVNPPQAQVDLGDAVGGQVKIRVNMSIPVFLRHKNTAIDFAIEKAQLLRKDGQDYLQFAVRNNSTRSMYPRVILDCKMPDGSVREKPLFSLAVYTEASRVERDLLIKNFDISTCASLSVRLVGADDFQFEGQTITEAPVTR